MNKKFLIHGCVLGGLILYTFLAWSSYQEGQKVMEGSGSEGEDGWSELTGGASRAETASGMVKVAVPLLLTAIYGAILAILYGLPMLAGKVSEGMMGSAAEFENDPQNEARAAVVAGEYHDAIAIYRKMWLVYPGNRLPLLEIAKLQREQLESPILAVNTLEEGLKEHEWGADDAAFLMFQIADIYEEDLKEPDKVVEVMNRVIEDLDGTRHAGNAAQKLRDLKMG